MNMRLRPKRHTEEHGQYSQEFFRHGKQDQRVVVEIARREQVQGEYHQRFQRVCRRQDDAVFDDGRAVRHFPVAKQPQRILLSEKMDADDQEKNQPAQNRGDGDARMPHGPTNSIER